MRDRAYSEEGSTVPLTIFFGVLCLVVVLIAVAATSLYLERKRLFTLADGAAISAAESFDLATVIRTPDGVRPALSSDAVASAVDEYLVAAGAEALEDLRVERAESVDARSATVTLSAWWRPPVLTLVVPEGLRLEVTAVGRSVFG
ncbi:MAG: pilus assembly protein TadG-related protein [Rhodoglobus sp.]